MTKTYLNGLLQLDDRRIILASASPRRVEMLRTLGLSFEAIPARIDERLEDNSNPVDYAQRLALSKARWVADANSADLIIAADTIVVKGGKVFGKPGNRGEAFQMISALSGSTHQVITAICLLWPEGEIVDHDVTAVSFYPLAKWEIDAYLDTGESHDKAGAYAIQGYAAPFVRSVQGCYANVVGFPLGRFYQHLKKIFPPRH